MDYERCYRIHILIGQALPRPSTISADAILDAVTRLAGERGATVATIQAISASSGASVGSLYHRFESRDALLARAWLRTAKAFLELFISTLDACDTIENGVRAALVTTCWARENRVAAALIVSHNRDEFLSAGAPATVLREAEALGRDLNGSLQRFAKRIGQADGAGLARCRYALVGLADGAVRLYLPSRVPPPEVDAWVEAAYHSVMSGLQDREQ